MSTKRPLRFDDLLVQTRASRPRVSPDGAWVFFVGTRPDPDENRNVSHLYRVPLDGGETVQITRHGYSNGDHSFSPDGKWIAFTSDRSGSPQIWVLPVDGGEARQVTTLELGAGRPVWFPDGKRLLAVSPVYRDTADQAEIARRKQEREKEKPAHRVIDRLMFRHWDTWTDDKVDHLFAVDVESGSATDLTPGPYPVPPRSLTGDPDYAVSPDGEEVCFVSLRDEAQALSTNTNLWTAPVSGPAAEPKRISPWAGCNAFPAYSPDGSRIAYLGMRRAGYEADKRELLVYDRATGAIGEAAPKLRGSAGAPVWSPDGERIYFAAQDEGRTRLYAVSADGGEPAELTGHATDHDPAVSPDGEWLVFARETLNAPPEIMRVPVGGERPRR